MNLHLLHPKGTSEDLNVDLSDMGCCHALLDRQTPWSFKHINYKHFPPIIYKMMMNFSVFLFPPLSSKPPSPINTKVSLREDLFHGLEIYLLKFGG